MRLLFLHLVFWGTVFGLLMCTAKDVPYHPTRPDVKPAQPCLDTLGPYPDCPPIPPVRRR